MKNILLIFGLLFTLSCSTDDSVELEDFETQMATLQFIELMEPYQGFGFSLYAQATSTQPKALECIPEEFEAFSLRSNYAFTGMKFDNGIHEDISGTMKLFECNYDEDEIFAANKISGIFENSDKELIFYYGNLDLDLKTNTISGKLIFSNGTGQFQSCSGEVEIIGTIEHGYLVLDCKGAMELN